MLSWFVSTALAATGDPVVIPGAPALIPDCARAPGGAETLGCGVELFGNISQILLGIVGALLLVLFIYGGVLFLISQGGDNVKKATGILQGAAIGMIVVFGAFSAINFGVTVLRGSDGGISTTDAYVTCSERFNSDGEPIASPGSEGRPCGPGLVCSNGLCVDQVVPPTN